MIHPGSSHDPSPDDRDEPDELDGPVTLRKPEPAPERRARRSLTHVGGDVTFGGDPESARALGEALAVAPAGDQDDEPERADVHGFHVYPARMHPTTAARLVTFAAPPGGHVLDPFAGSGTVLVEAVANGRRATGSDLNPLAVKLAKLKLREMSPRDLERLVARAAEVRHIADTRRKEKSGASRRYPREDAELFDPHVLLELDSLRVGIAESDPADRDPLELVLSSLLVKVSKKRGDTSNVVDTRRLAAGYTSKLFLRKTEELAQRLAAFAERAPSPRAKSRVVVDDATSLLKVDSYVMDAVVSSPPYVATYDYAEHHALRMRWLGLSETRFAAGELGSRRAYAKLRADEAVDSWLTELEKLLGALGRVVKPGGRVVLVMADSAVAGRALRADDLVAEACEKANKLFPVARASQARPHFHGPTASAFRDEPRREHALLLERKRGL